MRQTQTFKNGLPFAQPMVQRKGGMRRKTRTKLAKSPRTRGKISIRRALQTFSEGDEVLLAVEPAVQEGMYLPRFHGKAGRVTGKSGECYLIHVQDGGKAKTLIVHPSHLRRV